MNTNYEKFLEVREEIYNKWKDSPYLKGFPEDRVKQVAIILDSLDLFLKSSEQSKDISLELTQKVLQDFIGFDLVSIQPILKPVGKIYYNEFEWVENDIIFNIKEEEINAFTRKLGVFVEGESDINLLAKQIRKSITKEIIKDLSNNVGTILKKKLTGQEDEIYINLVQASDIIHKKTLRSGTKWIIVSNEMANRLSKYINAKFESVDEIKKIGAIGSAWNVYVNPDQPDDEILCGFYKQDQLLNCYIYSPYILLSQSGVFEDLKTRVILSRYGKKLIKSGGSKYYAKIKYEELKVAKDVLL